MVAELFYTHQKSKKLLSDAKKKVEEIIEYGTKI